MKITSYRNGDALNTGTSINRQNRCTSTSTIFWPPYSCGWKQRENLRLALGEIKKDATKHVEFFGMLSTNSVSKNRIIDGKELWIQKGNTFVERNILSELFPLLLQYKVTYFRYEPCTLHTNIINNTSHLTLAFIFNLWLLISRSIMWVLNL